MTVLAVAAWARVRGYLVTGDCKAHHDAPWTISFHGDRGATFGPGIREATRRGNLVRTVDQDSALLAALCIEGGHTLDVGRCPECGGSGEVPGDPPSWANPYGEPPEPCWCGDGRHTIESARLVLDAAPVESQWEYDDWHSAPPSGPGADWEYVGPPANVDAIDPEIIGRHRRENLGWVLPHWYRRQTRSAKAGDPTARERLEVFATLRADAGDPLGEWLALWIAGRDGWQIEAMERLHGLALGKFMQANGLGAEDMAIDLG